MNKEREAIKNMLRMLFDKEIASDNPKRVIIETDWGKPYTLIFPDGSHTHCSFYSDNEDEHLEGAVDSFVNHFTTGAGLSFIGKEDEKHGKKKNKKSG
jgi:hypothetical protein